MNFKIIFLTLFIFITTNLYAETYKNINNHSFTNINASIELFNINHIEANNLNFACIDREAEIQYIISSQIKKHDPLLENSRLNISKVEVKINDEVIKTYTPYLYVYYGTDVLSYLTIDKAMLEKFNGQNVNLSINITANEEDENNNIIVQNGNFGVNYNNILISLADNTCQF